MRFRRGDAWGEPAPPVIDAPTAGDDASLADIVVPALLAGVTPPSVLLLGGDLHRSVGAPDSRARISAGTAVSARIDAIEVTADGRRSIGLAHVIARRPLWAGHFVVVMNAAFVGDRNLGPRAHPGDGILDITEGRLVPGDRLRARRRTRSGSHLPHPDLDFRRVGGATAHFDRPTPLWVDGRRSGDVVDLQVRVLHEAATLIF